LRHFDRPVCPQLSRRKSKESLFLATGLPLIETLARENGGVTAGFAGIRSA
jgi:hypothetical protein